MRVTHVSVIVSVLTALLGACGSSSDDSASPTDGGTKDGGSFADSSVAPTDSGAEKDSGRDAGPVPKHRATAISFDDHDPAMGSITGTITIQKATDESDVDSYDLYWGVGTTAKLTPIATIPKTGSDLTYPLTGSIPAGATDFLVVTSNANGEMATNVNLTTVDHYPQFVDLSAGATSFGGQPSTAIDTVNHKLLIAALVTGSKPGLLRCNLDGTSCTGNDISASQPANSGMFPSLVVDTVNQKILVATEDDANSGRVALFRCNLDGTSCAYIDVSASQGVFSGLTPSAVIDTTNNKLLIVAASNTTHGPSLYRSNLDGTSPTFVDMSAGQPSESCDFPKAVIDPINSKLLTVVDDFANGDKPGLFRCNLDGTSCTFVDISASQPSSSGRYPFPVIDAVSRKLLVLTENVANGGRPALFRCDLDGTSCTYTDVSAGQAANTGSYPSAVVDPVNQHLLIATENDNALDRAALFQCNLDGTSCKYIDMSDGQLNASGATPSAVYDDQNKAFLLVANAGKPALYLLGL